MNVKTLNVCLVRKTRPRLGDLKMLARRFPGRYLALGPKGSVIAIAATLQAAEHKAIRSGVLRPVLLRIPKLSE